MTLHPIHPDGIALLKELEGLRLEAYKCQGKVWTIGYGHTAGVKKGDTITAAQAEEIFEAEVWKFADGVRAALDGVALSAYRFAALVCLAYNIGLTDFRDSTVLKRIKAGKFAEVPRAMRMWNKADGKISPGLIKRREREIELWNRAWKP